MEGASKITIEEETPQIRMIQGVDTANVGMIGITEKGPVGTVTLSTSWEEWRRTFGGDIGDGFAAACARTFFEEGGQRLYTVRTVHYTDVDDASTKTSAAATVTMQTGATAPTSGTVLGTNVGPFALTSGDTIIVNVDGGGATTATITATAASRVSGAETFALSNGQTLTVSVDGGAVQTVSFLTAEFVAIGAATAEEVAAVINAKLSGASATVTGGGTTVTITSDTRGTSSGINVTGGTANGALGYTTGNTAGGGNVADIAAVTVAEIKTIVEAAVTGCTVTNSGGAVRISSNTTGGSSTILVTAASTADDELGLDNATHTGSTGAAQNTLQIDAKYDGAYANSLQIRIQDATNGDSAFFDLHVLRDGLIVERFITLTMDSTSDRYVEAVINAASTGSALVEVTDLALSGTAAQRRPTNATSSLMTGGDDGLTSLADTDFVGSSAGDTGLYAFDAEDSISMIISPDRATSAVHNAMISYCEVWREMSMVALLDPPANQSETDIVTYVESTASLLGASEFAAMFWPRVSVLNPSTTVYGSGNLATIPPSGVVAGVIARGDRVEGGVYKPAAGIERGRMLTVLGFETEAVNDVRKRDIVFPKCINPLRGGDGVVRHIDGFITLKTNGNFPYLSERRGAIYIEQSIKRGLDFARWRNNDESLRAEVTRSVRLFLIGEMRKRAFRSMDPAKAFFIDFGPGLNTEAMVFAGKLKGRVGIATQKPMVWGLLSFSQDTRALVAEAEAAV